MGLLPDRPCSCGSGKPARFCSHKAAFRTKQLRNGHKVPPKKKR